MTALAYVDPLMQGSQADWDNLSARSDLERFTAHMFPGYQSAKHIRLLCHALDLAIQTPGSRLIITMPPRHSKSLHVSENLPAYYLGKYPDCRVIAASHTASLAYTFSRRVRNKLNDPQWPFNGLWTHPVRVADDKGAVQAWDIHGHRGGYLAVGVGGSPTGHGADLIVIDDPIRSAADADSETAREALWEWYQGTIRTRLQPGGSIILTACMVGGTEVTMADGSIKHLRDVAVGDAIATYENGSITTSRILNWINHGPDYIYEIRMKSGKIVRANGRHPFLVERGESTEWVRLRDLKVGTHLLRVEQSGGLGSLARPVCGMDAKSQPNARVTATSTTAKRDGPPATVRLHTTTNTDEVLNSSAGMASPLLTTTPCSQIRVAAAPFAGNVLMQSSLQSRPTERTGGYSSITVMPPERSEGYSATTATSPLATATPKNSYSGPLDTFAITPDEIIAIVPAGVEDVFDIEVERTENFIADGVVSHNTRWHEDDLTGRLLEAAKHGGEQWEHIHMPAIGEDSTALWPEYWTTDALLKIKQSVGSRVWEAQYQGRPQPTEGGMFKRHWWRYWQPRGANMPPIDVKMPDGSHKKVWAEEQPAWWEHSAQSWDMTFKETKSGSFVVGLVGAIHGPNAYLLDCYRDRVEFTGAVAAVRRMTDKHPTVSAKLIEDKANGPAVMDSLRATIAGIIPIGVDGSKESRAHASTPRVESGNWLLPHPDLYGAEWVPAFINELSAFPTGAHDDQVDAFSQLDRYLMGRGSDMSSIVTDYASELD